MEKIEVIWFKRDLRVEDHAALSGAVATKRSVLPLYILEPDLWKQPDMSYRHYQFLCESIIELNQQLSILGQPLIVRIGDVVAILNAISQQFEISGLWSHQETWNGWTYERDKRVLKWVRSQDIPWHEPVQNGVIRRLKGRDGWAAAWYLTMKKPPIKTPKKIPKISIFSEELIKPEALGLQKDGCVHRQTGGRGPGLKLLHSFLYKRGEGYTLEMSSPVTAYNSCSLLSPHLAFGTLSIREVFHAMQKRKYELSLSPSIETLRWKKAIRSFEARLRWHCHFIQKLEDEPRIEFQNFHSAYNTLREKLINQAYFEAWKTGNTGYPMIDACMRALKATGWINFRMRAMLMSFASYHLWLPWQEPALHLANLFTDYEPGIHYSQVQMQSGTSGINAIRIYNPIKQGIDQDPKGTFIKKWIPELVHMPNKYIHMPWKNPAQLNGYPLPIVDEKVARIAAAKKLYNLRKNIEHKLEARRIVTKHGSRKKSTSELRQRAKQKYGQLELPL
jgi:deoxyribodipyrimidine photo-lyase